jgi:serine O-acetyltransferase
VKLGANCNLSPMVIIGFGAKGGRTGVPTVGDRVYVAPGAKIIGPIVVGSDVAVGANAVVCRDVPEHVTVGGVPAKVISLKGSAPYLAVGQALDVAPAAEARSAIDEIRASNEVVIRQRKPAEADDAAPPRAGDGQASR